MPKSCLPRMQSNLLAVQYKNGNCWICITEYIFDNIEFISQTGGFVFHCCYCFYICRQMLLNLLRLHHNYRQTCSVSRNLVGATPTTCSLSTCHLASMNCSKTTARYDEKHISFKIWCVLYLRIYCKPYSCLISKKPSIRLMCVLEVWRMEYIWDISYTYIPSSMHINVP